MILHDGVRVTFWPQGGSTEVLFSTDRTGLSEVAFSVPMDGGEREPGKKGGGGFGPGGGRNVVFTNYGSNTD